MDQLDRMDKMQCYWLLHMNCKQHSVISVHVLHLQSSLAVKHFSFSCHFHFLLANDNCRFDNATLQEDVFSIYQLSLTNAL
jgi:hypothetical protein